jgi:hypothetical protein
VPAAACWDYVEIPHSIQSSIKPPNLNNRIFWGAKIGNYKPWENHGLHMACPLLGKILRIVQLAYIFFFEKKYCVARYLLHSGCESSMGHTDRIAMLGAAGVGA